MTAATGGSSSDNNDDNDNNNEQTNWKETILSILKGESSRKDSEEQITVKQLRKLVLVSMQNDDKDGKKMFKKMTKKLEKNGDVKIDADGHVTLLRSSSKDDKKNKKRKKKSKKDAPEGEHKDDDIDDDEQQQKEKKAKVSSQEGEDSSSADRNKPCKGNPQGVTRLFLGNLPFAVDENSLEDFLPNKVTHIKWITDKETGKFYGSAFVEMENSRVAGEAVAMAGQQLMGRPIKINFAPARPGDVWPPPDKVISGNVTTPGKTTTGGQAGGRGIKAMSTKPENCVKLFIGNLSYDIDDDGISKFFASVDAELKAVRWLHHQDSGDFKGCGFVEFWNTEACEKAATLNGKSLLGRPIRIDWTD